VARRDQLDLPIIEAEAVVMPSALVARSRGHSAREIRCGQLSMIAGAMVLDEMSAKRLGGEDDGDVLLAQDLQPLANARREERLSR